MLALFTPLALVAQTSASTAGDPPACHHFRLIERTDIIGRAAPSPDSVPTRDICVPPGYFRPWQGRREKITDLAITAKLPSMEGIWDKPLPGKEYDPVTHGNLLIIWFALSTSFTSVDFRFHADKQLFKDNQPSVPQFGLEHLIPDQTNTRPESEIYFKPEEIHSMFIECKLPSYARFPGCTETFEFQGYLVHVQYSHVFLPNWVEIQEKVKHLILSFEEGIENFTGTCHVHRRSAFRARVGGRFAGMAARATSLTCRRSNRLSCVNDLGGVSR
jgi:hypothetical protein